MAEASSNSIASRPHDDKQQRYLYTVCGEQFTRKRSLNTHRKHHVEHQVEEYVYLCSQCEKRFSAPHDLYHHMNVHTSRYTCTECGECCRSSSDLAVHRRSHSGEKPFVCTVCGRRFTKSNNLSQHCRIHSGEKPYKCHVCDMVGGVA